MQKKILISYLGLVFCITVSLAYAKPRTIIQKELNALNDIKTQISSLLLYNLDEIEHHVGPKPLESSRIIALKILDQARFNFKTQVALKELSNQKNLFSKQFLSSDSFQAYQNARGLAAVEKWQECIKELDEIKELDQDCFDVQRLRASCWLEQGYPDSAKKIYTDIAQFFPRDEEALLGLMQVSFVEKNYTQALKSAEFLDSKNEDLLEKKHILTARSLYGLGKLTEAFEVLETDVSKNKNHILSHYWLGFLYSKENFNIQAQKYFSLFKNKIQNLNLEDPRNKKYKEALQEVEKTFAKNKTADSAQTL